MAVGINTIAKAKAEFTGTCNSGPTYLIASEIAIDATKTFITTRDLSFI